jgi:hypothetical protein
MKSIVVKSLAILLLITIVYSCNKKESGVCYCKYLSGDKKEYNLKSLTRSQQIDSCYVLDGLANGFAGDCELK